MKKVLILMLTVVFVLSLTLVGVGCKQETTEPVAAEEEPTEEMDVWMPMKGLIEREDYEIVWEPAKDGEDWTFGFYSKYTKW